MVDNICNDVIVLVIDKIGNVYFESEIEGDMVFVIFFCKENNILMFLSILFIFVV